MTLTSETSTTEAVVNPHLERFAALDLQGVVADYAPDAVMIVPTGVLRGVHEITPLFQNLFAEFAKPGAPPLDFVFTVCDDAAGEACPVWPGQPMTAHWGVPDPAEARGSEAEIALAFKDAYRMLFQRIGIFTALPIRGLDKLSLQNKLREIGHMNTKLVEPS